MEDKSKYINSDLSELNFKLSSLYEIIKIKEISNAADIKRIDEVITALKNDNSLSDAQKNLLPEITELINTLKYDLSELKNKIIKSDYEIEKSIKDYDILLNYGDNSIREAEEIKNKKESYKKELEKYEIKPNSGYGYKGKLDINSIPFNGVSIPEQFYYELEKVDLTQKQIVDSMKTGFRTAGTVLSSAIADSIIPLGKVNSLTKLLVNSFIEATTKALLMKTILSGFENIFTSGFNGNGVFNSIPLNGILPVEENAIINYHSIKNYEQLKSNVNLRRNEEITVNIPQVEFKQKGYDLHAVIKKVNLNNNRYL